MGVVEPGAGLVELPRETHRRARHPAKASLCDHLRRVADVKHAVRGTKQMDVRVVLLRRDDRLKTMPEVLTRVLTEL